MVDLINQAPTKDESNPYERSMKKGACPDFHTILSNFLTKKLNFSGNEKYYLEFHIFPIYRAIWKNN